MGQLAGWIKIQGDIPWFIVLSKKQKDTFKEPLIHISHLVKKKKPSCILWASILCHKIV